MEEQVGSLGITVRPQDMIRNSPEARHGDLIDQSHIDTQAEIASALQKVFNEMSQEMSLFTKAAAAGTEDVCHDCGDPIPPKRRAAAPHTVWCVHCKSKRES